ncbi:hypothetical protein ACFL6C_10460 [Myxococcota bacterium]
MDLGSKGILGRLDDGVVENRDIGRIILELYGDGLIEQIGPRCGACAATTEQDVVENLDAGQISRA